MDEEQIMELINKYESEITKLKYQQDKINEIIVELRIMRKNASGGVSDYSSYVKELPREKIVHQRRNIPMKAEVPDILPDEDIEPNLNDERSLKEEREALMRVSLERRGRGRPRKITREGVEETPKQNLFNMNVSGESKRFRKKGGYSLSTWDKMILTSLNRLDEMLSSAEMYVIAEKFVKEKGMKMSENQIRGKISRSITKLTKRTDGILRFDSRRKGYVYGLYDWFSRKGEPKPKYMRGL
ncbi:MAG: hypothetical protein U0354_15860 [Candidatus Sericytochromatia bacterium]